MCAQRRRGTIVLPIFLEFTINSLTPLYCNEAGNILSHIHNDILQYSYRVLEPR